MGSPLGKLSTETFLQEYWQKKPCLIRQAFPDFEPILDGNDLAGLACEEMAESRMVKGCAEQSDWELVHGPFSEDDFSDLPEENWTLLVQDVEKHYAPLQALMQQFSFIPNWRLDDLMISFAAPGGSVGPHTDQYDVFLLQAEGKRRWQIASSFDPELLTDCPLKVLKQFDAEQEWVLEAGDMLYLPPNIAHHGVALEPGMSWSIGSRAPSAADLLQGLGEWLAFSDDDGGRYTDPDLKAATRAGEISDNEMTGLKQFMRNAIENDDGIESFLASFMSRFRLAHEPVAPPDMISAEDLISAMKSGHTLHRNPWTRITWIESAGHANLYASGQTYKCSVSLAESLSQAEGTRLESAMLDPLTLATLTQLINEGHFIISSN